MSDVVEKRANYGKGKKLIVCTDFFIRDVTFRTVQLEILAEVNFTKCCAAGRSHIKIDYYFQNSH